MNEVIDAFNEKNSKKKKTFKKCQGQQLLRTIRKLMRRDELRSLFGTGCGYLEHFV